MKRAAQIILSLLLFMVSSSSARAIVDPLAVPNNKFGIHLMDENDLNRAAELVNSTGGDWGYVTLVIREDERDTNRWNRAFRTMKKLHLIPLVRIATEMTNDGWTQGSLSEIGNWTTFLDSLEWPTVNRYIIVGNEPNHATEWHGEISPEEYTDYLVSFSQSLKSTNDRFFVLPAGLDASAPSDNNHMDEETYLRRMITHNADVFDHIDGWNSHSYPNPAFMGSVSDTGRKSIRTYEWELELLENLDITKNLPVFITETGWVHNTPDNSYNLSENEVAENLVLAFTTVWTDERIVAITPFILTFPGKPFDVFSWTNEVGEPYSFYYAVRDLEKIHGQPVERMKRKLPQNDNNTLILGIDSYSQLVYNIYHFDWMS